MMGERLDARLARLEDGRIRRAAEQLAQEYGLDVDELLAEAQRIVARFGSDMELAAVTLAAERPAQNGSIPGVRERLKQRLDELAARRRDREALGEPPPAAPTSCQAGTKFQPGPAPPRPPSPPQEPRDYLIGDGEPDRWRRNGW